MVARKTPLRTVKPGEVPPDAKPKTVSEAAAGGDVRELLVSMKSRLALAVENPNTPPRDLAALTRRLHEVVRDIQAIDAASGEGDDVGEAAATPDQEFDAELS